MKVLVSGAGGFLGQCLVELLLQRGHAVRAILRLGSAKPSWIDKVDPFYADLVHDNLLEAFDRIDAVVHLAGVTNRRPGLDSDPAVVATERLFSAMAPSKARRLIHVSSLSIYDWSLARTILDEHTPVLNDPAGMGEYAAAKLLQETLAYGRARTDGWDLTVLRPGFIWGPGRAEIAGTGRRFWRCYLLIGPFSPLPLCHVANCADSIVAALERPAAAGETFNVVDHNNIKRWRYLYEYIKRTGQFGLVLPVPYGLGFQFVKLASFAARRFLNRSNLPSLLTPRRFEAQFKPLIYGNVKLRDNLHWIAPLDFKTCLSLTYRAIKPAR